MKKVYIEAGKIKDEELKRYLSDKCFEVACETGFATDYEDVSEHLFCDDHSILTFVLEYDVIKGFAICAGVKTSQSELLLHVHGVILMTSTQGKGVFDDIVSGNIGYIETVHNNAKVVAVTARTQNPAVYRAIQKVTEDIYPSEKEISEEFIESLRRIPFISNDIRKDLIEKDAYASSKIQKYVNDDKINELFDIPKTDARIVVGMQPKNLNKIEQEIGRVYVDGCEELLMTEINYSKEMEELC